MNHENLIISDEWSFRSDENILKVIHREQQSTYSVSQEIATSIHIMKWLYFVFDNDEIVLMYDASTGIIQPLTVNEENILCKDERSMRKSHVSMQFTRFLFGEFLRNCGLE